MCVLMNVRVEVRRGQGEWVLWVEDVCGTSCCDMVGISRGVTGTEAEHAAG